MTRDKASQTVDSGSNSTNLAQNSAWNFLGLALPAILALVTIPSLIAGLGAERFGVLTLAWIFIGYFSLFDMGLGRAMTQMIARHLDHGPKELIASIFWTGWLLITAIGVITGVALYLISPWLTQSVFTASDNLVSELNPALILVAMGLPLVVSSTGLQGMLEAHQQFKLISMIKLIQGAVTFLGPLLAIQYTTHLAVVIGVLLCGRAITWLLFFKKCVSLLSVRTHRIALDSSQIAPMIRLGGWMSVSNIISPLLVYADKFAVGTFIPMANIAFYTTPAEMVVKLLVLPNAVLGVVFPVFASTYATAPHRTAQLYLTVLRYLMMALIPISIFFIGFASLLLEIWLGSEFAANSYKVMQWMIIGIFFNALAHIPAGMIGAAARPDMIAKLHLIEAPIYLAVLWILITKFGIEGAAIAWVVRTTADTIALSWIATQVIKPLRAHWLRMVRIGFCSLLVLCLITVISVPAKLMAVLSTILIVLWVLICWIVYLDRWEKEYILGCGRSMLVRCRRYWR